MCVDGAIMMYALTLGHPVMLQDRPARSRPRLNLA